MSYLKFFKIPILIIFLSIIHGSLFINDTKSEFIYSDSAKYTQDIIGFALNKKFTEVKSQNDLPYLYSYLASYSLINLKINDLNIDTCNINNSISCKKIMKRIQYFNLLCFVFLTIFTYILGSKVGNRSIGAISSFFISINTFFSSSISHSNPEILTALVFSILIYLIYLNFFYFEKKIN